MEAVSNEKPHWTSLGGFAILAVAAANAILHPALVLLLLVGGASVWFVVERPYVGTWLVLLSTPIETIGPLTFTMSKSAKLGLTMITAAALYAARRRNGEGENPYLWPFLLSVFSGLLATLLSSSPFISASGLVSIGIFVLFYSAIRRSEVLDGRGPLLLRLLLYAAVLSTGLSIVQLTQGYGGSWVSPDHKTMDAELAFSTVWPGISRASGAFNGPNAAGAFFAAAAIAAWMHGLRFRPSRARYLLIGCVCWLDVMMTFSRGALLGCVSGFTFAAWTMGFLTRRRLLALASCLALLLACLLASGEVRTYLRFGADLDSVSPERMDAWHATSPILRQHPFFGIGYYQFQAAAQGITGVSDTPQHPHNGCLKALVEQGPIGACAYVWFFIGFVRASIRSVRAAVKPMDQWVLGTIAGIGMSFFTQELFDANFTWGGSSLAILFAAMLGLQASFRYDTTIPPA